MNKVICDICGTSYPDTADQCPICGYSRDLNGDNILEETVAPAGYNKLTSRQMLTIANANLDAIFDGGTYSKGSGVQVVNKTGSMLPETGAEGTVLFITFGTIVVLGTGVLLVTKKRMGMIQ
mgnify:CR=1 FL=1